jgi:hypothetical protein
MQSTALCLASVIFLFASAPAADTPEALIKSLYARHQPGKNKNLDWCDKKAISKYADARLTALFLEDCACARRTREICNLDSDPFYDAQDFDDGDPNPRVKQLAANSYEVTFSNFGDQKLIYKMKKTSAGWRVSDIDSPSNKWSLVKLLSTRQE